MKDLIGALVVIVAACALAAAQPSAGGTAPKKEAGTEKKAARPEKVNVLEGTLQAVDLANSRLTVKDQKGMNLVIAVPAEAGIMKEGKALPMSELKIGEAVRVLYEGELSSPLVKSVKIGAVGAKKDGREKKGGAGRSGKKEGPARGR